MVCYHPCGLKSCRRAVQCSEVSTLVGMHLCRRPQILANQWLQPAGPTMPCFDPSRVLTQPVACYATLMGELPCLALPWAACGNQWHCMQNLLLSFFCHELFWHPLLEATTWNLARYARMTLLQQKHLWQLLLQNCSSLHKPFPQHLPRPSTSVLFAFPRWRN